MGNRRWIDNNDAWRTRTNLSNGKMRPEASNVRGTKLGSSTCWITKKKDLSRETSGRSLSHWWKYGNGNLFFGASRTRMFSIHIIILMSCILRRMSARVFLPVV
jgi:hypothetical protein